jgi:DNA repair protein RadD
VTSKPLRDYQVRAIMATREAFRRGARAVVLVLPTGGGKTRTAAEIIGGRLERSPGRVWFLAPRKELVEQAYRAIRAEGIDAGILAASSKIPPNPAARVQVCSVGTLLARGYGEAPPTDADLFIFDECHMAPSAEWAALMTAFPNVLRLGLTATPARESGAGMAPLFDALVVGATVRQLTRLGFLAPLDIVEPGRVLASGQIAQSPVDAYEAHAPGEKALVFAPHVRAALEFRDEFREHGVPSEVVDGAMRDDARAATLARYASGELRVVVNVGCLTTGYDDPETSTAILARRCGSVVLYLQVAGRILRPHASKTRALLVDLTGATRLHGRPDIDRLYALDGRAITTGEEVAGSFCAVCGAVIEGRLCVDCGYERPEQEAPKVVGAPLKKLAADYCAGDSPATIVNRLARWIDAADTAGHKPGSALFKFKGVYRRFPTSSESASAQALAAKMRLSRRDAVVTEEKETA